MPRRNSISRRFGRLIILGPAPSRRDHGYSRCQCSCGTRTVVRNDDLRAGKSVSCGCFRAERAREANLVHGMTDSIEFRRWQGLLRRCLEVTHKSHRWYKNVPVCKRWRKSFLAFYRDVGPCPDPKLELDRRDNRRGYVPGNVRWRTHAQNMTNTRRSKRYRRAA
jgi:hypothetical protein